MADVIGMLIAMSATTGGILLGTRIVDFVRGDR